MAAPREPRRGNLAASASGRRRPRGSGRAGARAPGSLARVPARADAGRRDRSRRWRAPRTRPPDCRPRCAGARRPAVRARRSHEWSRAPPRSAAPLRWRGTSSWPRPRRSTVVRRRSRPPPTWLARRSPPGRSAPGPRGRAPRLPRSRSPGGPNRPPAWCRHVREHRPTGTTSPPPVSRGAAPARHARLPHADRRCARWLRRPPPSTDRPGSSRASCRRRCRRQRLTPSTAPASAARATPAL